MISDKELADAVIALGVGELNSFGLGYEIDKFVREPRTAIALMEKACVENAIQIEQWEDSTEWAVDFGGIQHGDDESLPRAITEACVKALT